MNFTEMQNNYPCACAEAFSDLRSDKEFWEAANDWNLEEMGKRVLVHLMGRKTDIELDLSGEFDPAEAADDVIRESRQADIASFNRKLY